MHPRQVLSSQSYSLMDNFVLDLCLPMKIHELPSNLASPSSKVPTFLSVYLFGLLQLTAA